MQDAPLAQLFVRWFVGQLSVSGLTYFFRTRAVRREMLSCEPPQADRPFAGGVRIRARIAQGRLKECSSEPAIFIQPF